MGFNYGNIECLMTGVWDDIDDGVGFWCVADGLGPVFDRYEDGIKIVIDKVI